MTETETDAGGSGDRHGRIWIWKKGEESKGETRDSGGNGYGRIRWWKRRSQKNRLRDKEGDGHGRIRR